MIKSISWKSAAQMINLLGGAGFSLGLGFRAQGLGFRAHALLESSGQSCSAGEPWEVMRHV